MKEAPPNTTWRWVTGVPQAPSAILSASELPLHGRCPSAAVKKNLPIHAKMKPPGPEHAGVFYH